MEKRLRQAMCEHEPPLTQMALAERVGVNPRAVSRWLRGTKPHEKHLNKICLELSVRREWLVHGAGKKYLSEKLRGWPDSYFNLDNALPKADVQKAQSLYESVNAQKESRVKWMRGNKGGDAIIDYVRKRIIQDVRNYEAKARQRSQR